MPLKKPMNAYTSVMAPDKALHTDKVALSCLLPQKPRQLGFAAEPGFRRHQIDTHDVPARANIRMKRALNVRPASRGLLSYVGF